ncbi:hypothetical protein R1flu_024123 [Riccia fluitans]|uniref:Uncharacterized protein n=1 Tax=Riccia fluitans TaxID=41844 RepID=A0ABD1XX07_9MARC
MSTNMMTFLRRCLNDYTTKIQQGCTSSAAKGTSAPELSDGQDVEVSQRVAKLQAAQEVSLTILKEQEQKK